MRGFVSDHVMRKARKDEALRKLLAPLAALIAEVAEQEGDMVRAIERVGLAQCMRVDAQLLDKLGFEALADGQRPLLFGQLVKVAMRPESRSAECGLKKLNGTHRDRVHHLLMEMRVAFRWRNAVLRKQVRVVQVHGLVV